MPEKKSFGKKHIGEIIPARNVRLLMGLACALLVAAVLMMALEPGLQGDEGTALSQAMISDSAEVNIDSANLADRVLEQKFQIHMEENDQEIGEIPYVEVWVLNDPFYPLMGEVGTLRNNEGVLASKEWQMIGFPNYESDQEGTTAGAPVSSQPSSSLPVTTGIKERVVMVEEVYEVRGIRYAKITVNEETYDKLKAGSEFAEVFKLEEIRDNDIVIMTCGDESYELQVNQLRKL
ncbi:MAG: hypothetical protein SWK76_16135 [Actinomycetota bacterium]|nr:hypothetical protein [Actinomycetota bacterium]